MGALLATLTHSQLSKIAKEKFESIPGHRRGYVTLEEMLDSCKGWLPQSAETQRLNKTLVKFFKLKLRPLCF